MDGVSLDVAPGEIHGFLGPNGAGKTTTIRMIAGLLKPTAGRVVIDGHDLAREPGARPRPRSASSPTARSSTRSSRRRSSCASTPGSTASTARPSTRRLGELLELFELAGWKDELVESFSHGMKQRLVMCSAFLHRPQAVLVDEPMVGLDPRGARLIKDVFRAMSRKGVAILMSTHTLEVAEEMCDRISIILGGKIIARGTVDGAAGARRRRATSSSPRSS